MENKHGRNLKSLQKHFYNKLKSKIPCFMELSNSNQIPRSLFTTCVGLFFRHMTVVEARQISPSCRSIQRTFKKAIKDLEVTRLREKTH